MNISIRTKRGFTLIELLIVVAIIAILASVVLLGLRGAREKGRDARRISDVRNVQTALEFFFDKCGQYPGTVAPAGTCIYPPVALALPADRRSTASWDALRTELVNARISINDIPSDPLSPNREYAYVVDRTAGNENRSYVLRAALEDANNRALLDDIDDNGLPASHPFYFITQAASLMECDEPVTPPGDGNFYYCIGE